MHGVATDVIQALVLRERQHVFGEPCHSLFKSLPVRDLHLQPDRSACRSESGGLARDGVEGSRELFGLELALYEFGEDTPPEQHVGKRNVLREQEPSRAASKAPPRKGE